MNISFDRIIDRHHTNCLKYDFALERNKPKDVLPLWVADMDFQTPARVQEDLQKVISHGIFGYTETKEDYLNAVSNWFSSHFSWNIQSDWLIKTPGIVYALAMAVRAFTKEGDSVLIQKPVYYPFSQVIEDNNRFVVNNPLVYKNGKYEIDFEDFEAKLISHNIKLFFFCSPHNPVGRVWRKDELLRIGNLCLKYNVLVVSDEIHCDFTYPGYKHTIFAALGEEFAKHSIICTAPSKTFNLAGLQVSNIFIPNPEIRSVFQKEIDKTGYSQLNTIGLFACQSAYTHGFSWLCQLKKYLYENLCFIREFLVKRLPNIHLVEPEGTYLVWLDFRSLQLSDEELEEKILHHAKLWLDSGSMFCENAGQFQRMNIACPKKTLEKALLRLESVEAFCVS